MPGQVTISEFVTAADRHAALVHDVRVGLTAESKWLPPKWFYDETGSRLFDEITRLPEYYPTRTEAAILRERAPAIVELAGANGFVELGSGTSEKSGLILDAMARAGTLKEIVLFDISAEVLRDAAVMLATRYDVDCRAIVGDFSVHLERIPPGAQRLWVFLGGTIGNLVGATRGRLLADLRAAMADGDHLLIGTDLVKDPERLVAAYDDTAGVTAEFNRNVLRVLNRELGATFHPERFEHLAVWDPVQEWIEMRLRSTADQDVRIEDIDLTVHFDRGEDLLTEVSAKFRPERLAAELSDAGFEVRKAFHDPGGDFQVTVCRPV